MFKRSTNPGESLHGHLNEDFSFTQTDNQLNIIDNYHFENINDKAIDFFSEEFKLTNYLEKVNVYFLLKKRKDNETNIKISNFARDHHLCLRKVLSVLQFLNWYPNIEKQHSIITEMYRRFEQMCKFYMAMEDDADRPITICLYPYADKPHVIKPPFHGRFWLTNNEDKKTGYIVDGSLNTFSVGMIFAQFMDEENFDAVNSIFQNKIKENNRVDGQPVILTRDDFTSIFYELRRVNFLF